MACLRLAVLLVALAAILGIAPAPVAAQQGQASEKRIALVIGNAAYAAGALSFPANDAGLTAQTLQAAGFDVVGARDLDGDAMRRALRDFVEKASQSGPDTVVAFYFSGYGLQFEGENYLAPIDANIARASDVPIQAIRVSDLLRPLAALPLKARIVVLDAARENPFARSGPAPAGGLALMDADPGTLIAFNAAPGSVAPPIQDAYGPYARALAEMIRAGGIPLAEVFDRARLRTSELTGGAVVPWDADRVTAPFLFFERTAEAPKPAGETSLSRLRDRPIRDLGAREAYEATLERDTIQGYEEFLSAFPGDPMARRVRALVAARREALTWRRSWQAGTPQAYWSYLRRYPRGPHAAEAERRLERLAASLAPPPSFEVLDYDVPPPPPDELVFFERPVLMFADPAYDLPPPPQFAYLEPIPTYFVDLAPPPPPVEVYVLPQPVYEPVPVYVERPVYVAPPPVNLITYNIHNTVIVNPQANTVVVRTPTGQQVAPLAGAAAAGLAPQALAAPGPGPAPGSAPALSHGTAAGTGAALGVSAAAAAMHVALPPSVAARAPAALAPPGGPNGRDSVSSPSGAPGPGGAAAPAARAIPGQDGRQAVPTGHGLPSALPALPGRPGAVGPAPAQPGLSGPQPSRLGPAARGPTGAGHPGAAPPVEPAPGPGSIAPSGPAPGASGLRPARRNLPTDAAPRQAPARTAAPHPGSRMQQPAPTHPSGPTLRNPASTRTAPSVVRPAPQIARPERRAPPEMRALPPRMAPPRAMSAPPPQMRMPARPPLAPPPQMRAAPQIRAPGPAAPQPHGPGPAPKGPAGRGACGGPGRPACH